MAVSVLVEASASPGMQQAVCPPSHFPQNFQPSTLVEGLIDEPMIAYNVLP